MPAEEVAAPNMAIAKRKVLVGIRFDSHSRELVNWALVKAAGPGDSVVAIHVCRSSGHVLKEKPFMDSYLQVYDGLCTLRKINLTGQISTGASARKTLVREAKSCDATIVVVGINSRSPLTSWASTARYCTKRLPGTVDVLAIHNGKTVFRRLNNNQLPGLNGLLRPNLSLFESHSIQETRSELYDSDDLSSVVSEPRRRSASIFTGDILDHRPGWPLLLQPGSNTPRALHRRQVSVVQWTMNLPDRSPRQRSHGSCSTVKERSENSPVALVKANSLCYTIFSYEDLKNATSKFSSENLIGKGGCNRVYKGVLGDGKRVAVKIQKALEEATKDFTREVDIISSLSHNNIAPLIGVCTENSKLISVYDFYSNGSLEENLHGKKKEECTLSWDLRFDIAVKIAEALNYQHNGCPRPIIHRDIKSSNILLTENFEPQLSDFGLAIWGPENSSFMTENDVVGTFGYLAPEYFMYGKVSDKIDVYAFGVVLLELLTGRKPIGPVTTSDSKEESLVSWAKPIIESGNASDIIDLNLNGKFDEAQMRRMVIAATLCITRSARLRPRMTEILRLLRGNENVEPRVRENFDVAQNEEESINDDEVYPTSSTELHLSVALLDVDNASMTTTTSTSFSGNLEQGTLDDYLKEM